MTLSPTSKLFAILCVFAPLRQVKAQVHLNKLSEAEAAKLAKGIVGAE
jgi:hypothetical protein